MNDNLIRYIIQEEIERFLNEDVEEARSIYDLERPRVKIIKPNGDVHVYNDGVKSKKSINKDLGIPEKPRKKRVVAKDIFSADPTNASQIRRTLRKSWESTLYPMYHLLSKFIKQYGEYNANWLLRQFGEADEYGKLTGKGLDTLYNSLYDKINRYTTDIEGYGSDLRHIKSRCGEIAQLLGEIDQVINKMCESCKKLKKFIRGGIKDPKVNPRIIDGYLTSGGLKQKAIYNDKSSEAMMSLNNYISKLIEQLEYISTYEGAIDMSTRELGITTKRG
jgi:hypothetical protein